MTIAAHQAAIDDILQRGPVLPLIMIDDPDVVVQLAGALVAGGIGAITILLRTSDALEAIEAAKDALPDVKIGAGTVLTATQLAEVERLEADFAISPGAPPDLIAAAEHSSVPLLPGISTVTEILALANLGYRNFNFYPANASGGRTFLSEVFDPLPQLRFCANGGIDPDTAGDYLSLPNVVCAAGYWLAPNAYVSQWNWQAITELAEDTAKFRR